MLYAVATLWHYSKAVIKMIIKNLFLVLSGVVFYVIGVTKGDTTPLQKTVEHLVNYTALEALDQLDLNAIGGAIVDDAYKNYSKQGIAILSNLYNHTCIHEVLQYS